MTLCEDSNSATAGMFAPRACVCSVSTRATLCDEMDRRGAGTELACAVEYSCRPGEARAVGAGEAPPWAVGSPLAVWMWGGWSGWRSPLVGVGRTPSSGGACAVVDEPQPIDNGQRARGVAFSCCWSAGVPDARCLHRWLVWRPSALPLVRRRSRALAGERRGAGTRTPGESRSPRDRVRVASLCYRVVGPPSPRTRVAGCPSLTVALRRREPFLPVQHAVTKPSHAPNERPRDREAQKKKVAPRQLDSLHSGIYFLVLGFFSHIHPLLCAILP